MFGLSTARLIAYGIAGAALAGALLGFLNGRK